MRYHFVTKKPFTLKGSLGGLLAKVHPCASPTATCGILPEFPTPWKAMSEPCGSWNLRTVRNRIPLTPPASEAKGAPDPSQGHKTRRDQHRPHLCARIGDSSGLASKNWKNRGADICFPKQEGPVPNAWGGPFEFPYPILSGDPHMPIFPNSGIQDRSLSSFMTHDWVTQKRGRILR